MRDYKVNKEAISESFCAEVYEIVRSVPVGRVTTYGEIAALLGKPQCSRMVGKALKKVPMELDPNAILFDCIRIGTTCFQHFPDFSL